VPHCLAAHITMNTQSDAIQTVAQSDLRALFFFRIFTGLLANVLVIVTVRVR